MAGPGEPDNGAEQRDLARRVRERRERSERWQREGERPLASNLALIGALGWLIVLPILGGLALGHWLDLRAGGGIFWTGALVVAGTALGCWLAWQRIRRE